MDNSPRFDRHVGVLGATWLGTWLGGGGARPHALSVDLCAFVAREMALAGRIADELGREEVRPRERREVGWFPGEGPRCAVWG